MMEKMSYLGGPSVSLRLIAATDGFWVAAMVAYCRSSDIYRTYMSF
jgi:hypothetical protein